MLVALPSPRPKVRPEIPTAVRPAPAAGMTPPPMPVPVQPAAPVLVPVQPAAPAHPQSSPHLPRAHSTDGLFGTIRRLGVALSEASGATLLFYLLLIAFLAVQDRIDRNDPKLALAPLFGEPDLAFEPPPHRGDQVP